LAIPPTLITKKENTMSTRANIKLINGDSIIWIYRHSDGYPSETGHDLAEKLKKSCYDFHELTAGILKDDAYRITTEQHGDIEYLYTIEFRENFGAFDTVVKNNIIFKCQKRDYDSNEFLYLDDYYKNQADEDSGSISESWEIIATQEQAKTKLDYYYRAKLKHIIRDSIIQLQTHDFYNISA
tara:strand:- start:2039 stop:2587 length:549 start_codon:yes stop_codon:yes gene_type:complete